MSLLIVYKGWMCVLPETPLPLLLGNINMTMIRSDINRSELSILHTKWIKQRIIFSSPDLNTTIITRWQQILTIPPNTLIVFLEMETRDQLIMSRNPWHNTSSSQIPDPNQMVFSCSSQLDSIAIEITSKYSLGMTLERVNRLTYS